MLILYLSYTVQTEETVSEDPPCFCVNVYSRTVRSRTCLRERLELWNNSDHYGVIFILVI